MKKFVLKDPADYIAVLERRRWWIMVSFLPLVAAVVLVTLLLPDVYISETLVFVEPKDVPDDVVKDFVMLDTQERLAALEERAVSRSNLFRILNDFPEGFGDLRSLPQAAQIERLRKRINIEVTTSRRGRSTVVPYFRISYQDRSPEMAQKVTARLATFFIELDAKTREDQVFGTAEFLKNRLSEVGQQLEEADRQLADLKEKYRYELPSQLDTNLRTLDRLQGQLQANSEARDRNLSLKLDLERRIAETSPFLTAEIRAQNRGVPLNRKESPLMKEYRDKEVQLAQALSYYTEKHPSVRRIKSEMAKLKAKIPPEDFIEREEETDGGVSLSREANPLYQSLTSELSRVKTELGILDEQRQVLNRRIALYSARIENTPKREQEIAATQRQFNALQARFDELRQKKGQAEDAESLESSQKGEQFQVVDPASYPLDPAKPNRILILLLGIAGSLAFGIFLAFAVEFVDQRIWNPNEVKELLGLSVIGEITEFLTESQLKKRRRRNALQGTVMVLLVGFCIAAVTLIYMTPQTRTFGSETLAHILGW